MTWKMLQGRALDQLGALPAASVHCVVTSPPYWGLRDYGLEPQVWNGGAACSHEWTAAAAGTKKLGAFCHRCSAWRGSLGLEPTPELYVAHLVAVFREVRRVLRDDGTVWLNLGDCYATTGGHADGACTDRRDQYNIGNRPEHERRDFRARPSGGLKPKDLVGIPWRVAFALQADGWWLRSDIVWSKCLSGGAWVYARTQKGEMPVMVKDLGRLAASTVSLWTGVAWSSLAAMHRIDDRPGAVEIELRNGDRIGCTLDHRWPTQRGLVEARHLLVGDTLAATTLPEPTTPRTPGSLEDELVGWFVGTYLADGSMSGETIQIASAADEDDRLKRLRAVALAFDGACRAHRTSARGITINLEGRVLLGILGAYVGGRTATDKHLAPRCWQRSNRFLRALLEGYLQGDGHEIGGRWVLGFCANDALARDLRVAAARLGASLRLRRTRHTFRGRQFPGWRGSLYFDPASRHQSDTDVVALRRSRARRFWEITLVDAPHLFALGCGVLTHNSNPMPESVTDRPTKAHEYLFLLAKAERYYYDAEAIKEPLAPTSWLRIGQTTFDEQTGGPKDGLNPNQSQRRALENLAAKVKRPAGWNDGPTADDRVGRYRSGNKERKAEVPTRQNDHRGSGVPWTDDGTGRNRRTVWEIATEPFPGAHFATFPTALVEPCIRAGTSERGGCPACGAPWTRVVNVEYENPGNRTTNGPRSTERKRKEYGTAGFEQRLERRSTTAGWKPSCPCPSAEPVPAIVADPFAGSGTVGVVALRLGRSFVGIELKPDYVAMARQRIIGDAPLLNSGAEA